MFVCLSVCPDAEDESARTDERRHERHRHLGVRLGRIGPQRVPIRGLRKRGETLYAIVETRPYQHRRPAAALLHPLPVQEVRQVGPLLHPGHQAEPALGRGLLKPGKRLQGAQSAAGGLGELQARRQAQARLHRRLHQLGGRVGRCRRHGGRRAGLRLGLAV